MAKVGRKLVDSGQSRRSELSSKEKDITGFQEND